MYTGKQHLRAAHFSYIIRSMSRQLKSNLMILLATFIWGTAFLAQKDGGRIGTFTFNGIRFLIGGAFLLPVIYVLDKLRAKAGRRAAAKEAGSGTSAESRGRTGEQGFDEKGSPDSNEPGYVDMGWNRTVLIGGLACGVILFIASSLQQYGVLYTSLGKTGFITALYAVIVPVFSIALGKAVHLRTWVAVAIGMTGLYLMSMYGESLTIAYGDRFVIGCAFGFAVQIMVIDHFSPLVDPVKLACVEFFTLGVISIPFMFIFESPNIQDIVSVLPSLLYASILSSGVAYTLQIAGQRYAEPTQAALMMCLESVFSLLTGMIMLGERMAAHEYIGALLIFIAVVMTQLPDREKKSGTGSVN